MKKIQKTPPRSASIIMQSLHQRYPATVLTLVAVLVILPIGLLAGYSHASEGDSSGSLELRLVTPVSNTIASRTVVLRGQSENGAPRKAGFIIDGKRTNEISAVPLAHGVWEAIWDTSGVENGDHTVSFRADDGRLSAMTGSVHVNVENVHPSLSVHVDQPTDHFVADGANLDFKATVSAHAKDVNFLVSQLVVDKMGHRQIHQVRKITAVADDAEMQHWSATTDPAGIVPHAFGLFQVQAVARSSGYSDTVSPAVPFLLTTTSSRIAIAGTLQATGYNFVDVDVNSPAMGASVSGTVSIVSSGTPAGSIAAVKVMVWDGSGYTKDILASKKGDLWTASWDTTELKDGWYWIQSQVYGPGSFPSMSEPLLVHVLAANS